MACRSIPLICLCLVVLLTPFLISCQENTSSSGSATAEQPIDQRRRTLHAKHPASSIALQPPAAVAIAAATAPVDFMNRPMALQRFESSSDALVVWRRFAAQKPALLLLSNNPLLQPPPEELRESIDALANNAPLAEIFAAGDNHSSNPLFLPGMVLDIALRNEWFSQLVWVLPLRDPGQELNLEQFRAQLTGTGLANEEEAAGLTLDENVFRGHLRRLPFTAAALPLLQDLPQPVIIHFDLGYFQPLYKNEIATPMLAIVHDTLATLRRMHLDTLAVTFSYSHHADQLSLDVRFLGDLLNELIGKPEILDTGVPPVWAHQADALYLNNFFQKEKIRELYQAQELAAPKAAWVKFNLFRSAAGHKEDTQALDYLSQAVALDRTYALEYLNLSDQAYENQRPEEALRMLALAAAAFPNDPFIKLQMAQLAHELGDTTKAVKLVAQLQSLPWSEVYYPRIAEDLSGFAAFLRGELGTSPQASSPVKSEATHRARILHAE